jgi:phosphofructokinase-like protein
MAMAKRAGILTGGGDCPGLNAAIRGAAVRLLNEGYEVVGLGQGWRGLLEKIEIPVDKAYVEEILWKGGTVLESSRTNPYSIPGGVEKAKAAFSELRLDALVAIGGDDTLGVAAKLYKQEGLPMVGVPKTMDNDVGGTEFCFGFDTAVTVAVDAVERLRDTARSHRRILVLEVMGRYAGWVALYTGMAGGADWILIPEVELDWDEMCESLVKKKERGKHYAVVVVSEGIDLREEVGTGEVDAFGHERLSLKGVGERVAQELEKRTGVQTRSTAIGYIQRGGSPTVFDRMLATRMGYLAGDLIVRGEYGKMAAMVKGDIVPVDLELAAETRTVPKQWYELAKAFFKES